MWVMADNFRSNGRLTDGLGPEWQVPVEVLTLLDDPQRSNPEVRWVTI